MIVSVYVYETADFLYLQYIKYIDTCKHGCVYSGICHQKVSCSMELCGYFEEFVFL